MGVSWFMAKADVETPEKREKCIWEPTRGQPDSKPCGSEENIFRVTHRNWYQQPKTDPICGEHLNKAWGKLRVDSAEKRPDKK